MLTHVTLLPCDPDSDNWSTAKVLLQNSTVMPVLFLVIRIPTLVKCKFGAEKSRNNMLVIKVMKMTDLVTFYGK